MVLMCKTLGEYMTALTESCIVYLFFYMLSLQTKSTIDIPACTSDISRFVAGEVSN